MPRFAANLTMLFNEWPFLDRFAAAADAGFDAVEILFPYDTPPDLIASQLVAHNLTLALINLPPGDYAAGERGFAAVPERAADFRAALETALVYARATGVKRLHAMAGLGDPSDPHARAAYLAALDHACGRAAGEGIDILIEPLNRRDMPNYFLNDFDLAAGIVAELDRPNLKLQFDVYHRQILHGDVTRALEAALTIVGHIQIAAVPHRHEPTTGELDDARLLRHIDALGYAGFVGLEYRPRAGTRAGLAWRERAGLGTCRTIDN